MWVLLGKPVDGKEIYRNVNKLITELCVRSNVFNVGNIILDFNVNP